MRSLTLTAPLLLSLACSGSSNNAAAHSTATATDPSRGVPGDHAAVRVTVRRVLIDEIDRAPDPTRVLLPPAESATQDAQAVHTVITALEQQRSAIALCYQRTRADIPDALGDVPTDLLFGPDGAIRDQLIHPEPVLASMSDCYVAALRAVSLQPAPGHDVGVHVTYRFQPHGATVQESRYRLTVHGVESGSPAPEPSAPPACVPLVLMQGFVTDNTEDEARRYPSLATWDVAQRARLVARLSGLNACYRRLLTENANASGAVQLRVVLGTDGAAQSVRVDAAPELHDVAECVRTRVTGAAFCPGPEATMTVLMTGIELLPQ